MSVHQTLLIRQWSDDVTFFSLEIAEDRLTGVRLADGTLVERDVVTVSPWFVACAHLLADLGLSSVEHPSGLGEHIPCDATGRTDVPGVWVAGNVTDLAAQVGAAAAAGAAAAPRSTPIWSPGRPGPRRAGRGGSAAASRPATPAERG